VIAALYTSYVILDVTSADAAIRVIDGSVVGGPALRCSADGNPALSECGASKTLVR